MMTLAVMLATMPVVQDHSAHGGKPATTPAASVALSLDTPVETLAANPASKAVLDKHFPEMLKHPMYDQFKQMSLKQLQPLAQGQITNDMLTAAEKDLAAIK
ncbi:hypothetical protein NYR55_11910 [Sphingomonas sp. BGYR3]|uniref:hypothetical protein n=1 Tax=Sphingomonas sp. BGYR3 TaxID=2975483 RepID=UPI0021A38846|nr:hypothetical protein [Sphingomonas sp. BGYR3]MDG5489320.1 hypothetical protein [Sphingomonas sp. BGYR3]